MLIRTTGYDTSATDLTRPTARAHALREHTSVTSATSSKTIPTFPEQLI